MEKMPPVVETKRHYFMLHKNDGRMTIKGEVPSALIMDEINRRAQSIGAG